MVVVIVVVVVVVLNQPFISAQAAHTVLNKRISLQRAVCRINLKP